MLDSHRPTRLSALPRGGSPWTSALVLAVLVVGCSTSSGDDGAAAGATSGSALGQACSEDVACASGLCIPETASASGTAWAGGSCSQLCGALSPCPPGGVCVTFADGSAYCASSCSAGNPCRAGYVCSAEVAACLPDCRLGWSCGSALGCDDATGSCVSPTGAVGGECTQSTECQSLLCIPEAVTETGVQWSGGYCSQECSDTVPCPDGSVCIPFEDGSAYCAAACADTTACRAGYVCSTAVGGCLPDCRQGWSCGSSLICDADSGLCGLGTNPIGSPCTLDAECASALCTPEATTATGSAWTGGSCTQACGADTPCPTGASCVPYEDGSSYCSASCAADTDCRSGYVCALAVSACLPDCRTGFNCGTLTCSASSGACE